MSESNIGTSCLGRSMRRTAGIPDLPLEDVREKEQPKQKEEDAERLQEKIAFLAALGLQPVNAPVVPIVHPRKMSLRKRASTDYSLLIKNIIVPTSEIKGRRMSKRQKAISSRERSFESVANSKACAEKIDDQTKNQKEEKTEQLSILTGRDSQPVDAQQPQEPKPQFPETIDIQPKKSILKQQKGILSDSDSQLVDVEQQQKPKTQFQETINIQPKKSILKQQKGILSDSDSQLVDVQQQQKPKTQIQETIDILPKKSFPKQQKGISSQEHCLESVAHSKPNAEKIDDQTKNQEEEKSEQLSILAGRDSQPVGAQQPQEPKPQFQEAINNPPKKTILEQQTINGYLTKGLVSIVRLKRIMEMKRAQLNIITEMNKVFESKIYEQLLRHADDSDDDDDDDTEAPKLPVVSAHFQRRYCATLLSMEALNRQATSTFNKVVAFKKEICPVPTNLHEACQQEAEMAVARNNKGLVTNPNVLELMNHATTVYVALSKLGNKDKVPELAEVLKTGLENMQNCITLANRPHFIKLFVDPLKHILESNNVSTAIFYNNSLEGE